MSEKLLLKDGLRIGKKELSLLQDLVAKNLTRLLGLAINVPATGAVFTTKTTAGVLGNDLKLAISGGATQVTAGTALSADLTYLRVPTTTTTVSGSFPVSTTKKVVLKWAANPLESTTVSVATGGLDLTFSSSVTGLYGPGDYIRISGSSAGNNGTFKILSVPTSTTATLAEVTGGTVESGLSHSMAGKFFPGYPTGGETTDISQYDGFSLVFEDTSYTVLSNEIALGTATKDGAGTVTSVTDTRVALTPQMIGMKIGNADVLDSAAIAESKLALTAELLEAKTMRHTQNTDTYTTSSIFRVKGATGPRVLTEQDISTVAPPLPPATATVLTQEVNYKAEFYNLAVTGINQHYGEKLPGLHVSWGIVGTGTYAANVFSITSAHDCVEVLAANRLANHLLVDSTGQRYKITASGAVTASTAFTVTVVIESGQAAPTNGAVTIRNNATSYRIEAFPSSGVQYSQSFQAPITSAGVLMTTMRPNMTGTFNESYRIELVSSNPTLSAEPKTQTLSKTVFWGGTGAPTINIPSSSITVSPTANGVTFSWPAPVGFNPVNMDYIVAYSNSTSSAPDFFNLVAQEISGGAGRINIPASYPQVAWIKVGVRDLSREIISTLYGEATGQPTNVPTNPSISHYESFNLTFGSFVNNGDGLMTALCPRFQNIRNVHIVGVGLRIATLGGTGTRTFKARVYPVNDIASAASSEPLSDVGSVVTTLMPFPGGNDIVLAVEKIAGGADVTLTGAVTLYYAESGGGKFGPTAGPEAY